MAESRSTAFKSCRKLPSAWRRNTAFCSYIDCEIRTFSNEEVKCPCQNRVMTSRSGPGVRIISRSHHARRSSISSA